MIKNWKQFIKENVTNPDSYLDMRMQEIKDLLDNTENSETLIYEWENKDDHELYVNFSANGMNVRYEFDIDDMIITKIANEVLDYEEEVESMEAGVEMIEKDIHSILGISESKVYSDSLLVGQKYKIVWPNYDDYEKSLDPEVEEVEVIRKNGDEYLLKNIKVGNTYSKRVNFLKDCEISTLNESKYEESILIIIEAGEGNAFLKNRYSNLEINRKLMRLLDKNFDLGLGEISDKHKIEGSKVSDISKFLIEIGLKKDEIRNGDRIRLAFKGNLTLKDFKKINSMKYLKKFNEAIVDYKSDDIDALMAEINAYPNNHRFQLSQLSEIGSEYNVEFVDYNTFLNDLSERDKSTTPPRTSQFFALVNRVNNKIRIVLNLPIPFIPKDFFNQVPIGDILKHEQIHTIQYSKKPFETPLPEPKDKKQYFSDKDEVMAFSFSIAKEIVVAYPSIRTPKEGIDKLIKNIRRFRLYVDIKENTDKKTLKRYHKYIYLYLEDLLKPEE